MRTLRKLRLTGGTIADERAEWEAGELDFTRIPAVRGKAGGLATPKDGLSACL
jgi:hypothetical protein